MMNTGIFKIKRIIYPRNETLLEAGDFAIVACSLVETKEGSFKKNTYGNYTFRGVMPYFSLNDDKNEEFTIVAKEVADKNYPNTYQIETVFTNYPINSDEEKRYFLSRVLTEKQMESLYAELEDPFEAIEREDLATLTKVKGIGNDRAKKIIEKYNRNKDYSELHIGLHEYGIEVTDGLAKKLMKRYGNAENAVKKIIENPYTLAYDIDGIGFTKADDIALSMGYPKDSVYRGKAFLEFFLSERGESGFSWVTPDDVFSNMFSYLGNVPEKLFGESLNAMHEDGVVTWNEEKTYIALKYYYDLEKKIANHLTRILNTKTKEYSPKDKDVTIKALEKQQGWEFTDEQLNAVDTALNENLCVITGSAGTGKTSGVGIMLKVLSDSTFAQCALSGKASSKLQEVTGAEGHTIHRLLGYTGDGFVYDEDNPLPYDIVILDEGSMVGGEIFLHLIRAIKDGGKLIILGDEGQLESIGCANVFKDMLDSETIPTVKLNKIHRQAQKSAISMESVKVRNGLPFIKYGWVGKEVRGELSDLVLDIYDDSLFTSIKILESYKEAYSLYNSIKDITVVVPSRYAGDGSAYNINIDIQNYVNPKGIGKKEVSLTTVHKGSCYPITYRVGDRILAKRNDRKTKDLFDNIVPIFNGFLGTIVDIQNKEMIVDFDTVGEVCLPKSYWRSLLLGYAITGHSMQGSENKCVVVGMDFSGYSLLSKEWIYTAITRAAELCYLVSETKALTHGLRTSKVPNKQTFLKFFLDEGGF